MWSICSILTARRRKTASFSSTIVQILKAVEIKGSKKHLFFNFEGIFPQYQHCFSRFFLKFVLQLAFLSSLSPHSGSLPHSRCFSISSGSAASSRSSAARL